ncbi:MAG TPA: ADP-ribosylation factor-like protein [candidate division Zixibacteria bacterium]|nr:ADP-ribosylation factor-like protein [candidate division Zixibacteria bacterium]
MSYLFEELESKDEKATTEDKILFMGLQQAGKTAIKDVVFFGKVPGDVEDYMATIHYERQYIDEEKKSLIIDSGGQESYWNEAVTHFRHLVFSNVKLLLWIIDTTRPDLFEESERRFSFTIRQFKKENPDGHICVLCHKVDLIQPEELVALLEHVRDSFTEKKYKIRFEASSIYYTDSLKELVFALMKDAGIDLKRFELITNLGKKVEQSEEFQAYTMEHQDDPRIRQLMDFLHPENERTLPTFGQETLEIDLSAYGIIEIVLIDKKTFSPVIGTSTQNVVSIEKSMDYIFALQEFKEIIRNKSIENDSNISIVTSSNQIVHGMVLPLESNYLLVTSFSEITEEKTAVIYDLVKEFSLSEEKIFVHPESLKKIPEKEEQIPTESSQEILTPPTIEKPSVEVILAQKEVISDEAPESSRFSFLNKLKEDKKTTTEVIETSSRLKIDESIIKSAELEKTEVQKISEDIIEPVVEEVSTIAPVVNEFVELKTDEVSKEEIIEEIIQDKSLEIIAEEITEDLIIKEDEKIESNLEIEQPIDIIPEIKEDSKPKSRFLARLEEERKRYKIRQLAIPTSDNGTKPQEKIVISKEDIEGLAQYLIKEKDSVPEEIFTEEEDEKTDSEEKS